MSDQLEQMILHYLADLADRGDHEAKILFDMLCNSINAREAP